MGQVSNQPSERYDSLFQVYAEWDRDKTGAWVKRPIPLDWTLLKAQAVAESDLDPDAFSPVGAQGLTQFMRATWDEWEKRQFTSAPPRPQTISPSDPEDAIWAQADMMAWLLSHWKGDRRKALASYNWGIGNVTRAIQRDGYGWTVGLPRETADYIDRILPLGGA